MVSVAVIILEFASAALSFVLVRFMVKPYLYTGDGRYVGLPFGFTLLGMSYLFMGLASVLESLVFADEMKWLQLFTEIYAFVFIAATYHFSRRTFERSLRLWWTLAFSALVLAAVATYLVFEPSSPIFTLPSYNVADRYASIIDIFFASYVSVYTLRSHAPNPDSRTLMAPLGYILLAVGEYSSLIWSLDSSFSALVGAYVIRFAGLAVLLLVSYQVFISSRPSQTKGEIV